MAVLLAGALARPAWAAYPLTADITVSSAPAPAPLTYRFGYQEGAGAEGRPAIGVSTRLSEGKPLEMVVWGGAGAVAGSLAGPIGAAIGGAIGVVGGLLISIFVVPHNGPEPGDHVSR